VSPHRDEGERIIVSRTQYEIVETLIAYDRFLIQRAVRRADGQRVLLKLIADECPSPRDRRRLEFEYRIIRKVDGPGVVRALALEVSEAEAFIVFEDTGCSVVSAGPKGVGLDLLFDMARQLAVGIGNVHHRGVVHNDIRTATVSLNPQTREVRLANFLLASELARERRDLNDVTLVPDALAYISPERTGRMNRDVDYRSDYYSLGVTLFELATGQRPFHASDPLGWAHCHISKRPPLASDVNPDVPAPLAEIIAKLLAKDPDDRYQSARGLLADLDRCRRSWRTTGSVAPFTLGTDDVGQKFAISRKLVGRERELETLLQSFARAVRGGAPLLLVSGESGIGKTCLIAEVHRPIVERRGYFVSGKFDQLDRTVPYAALASALRGLAQQLLVEPEDRLARWRAAIGEALGPNQRVLLDLVPELEPILKPILSPQTPAPANARGPLVAAEVQRRFKQAFQALVGVFARPDHPLVMFLDDLQWADASTLDLLQDLCSSGNAHHLLVIAAYRDGEVYEGHPLSLALKEITEARPDGVSRISLGPLDEDGVRRMIADTLRSTADQVRPLADFLFQKTGGNPFFVNELLGALHRDGMFTFDVIDARWRFDVAALADVSVTDDVADLLARRLREMPPESLAAVQTAACVGFAFDLSTLATVSRRSVDETAAMLWEPIRRGILVPLDANYRLVGQNRPAANEPLPEPQAPLPASTCDTSSVTIACVKRPTTWSPTPPGSRFT
jgi:tRNA A-37 threonylcarbamoyl transferase component Bud32